MVYSPVPVTVTIPLTAIVTCHHLSPLPPLSPLLPLSPRSLQSPTTVTTVTAVATVTIITTCHHCHWWSPFRHSTTVFSWCHQVLLAPLFRPRKPFGTKILLLFHTPFPLPHATTASLSPLSPVLPRKHTSRLSHCPHCHHCHSHRCLRFSEASLQMSENDGNAFPKTFHFRPRAKSEIRQNQYFDPLLVVKPCSFCCRREIFVVNSFSDPYPNHSR
jgi:hypothetical protein